MLQEGMKFQVEPSRIEQGDARYHIEDSVLVVEDGAEMFVIREAGKRSTAQKSFGLYAHIKKLGQKPGF